MKDYIFVLVYLTCQLGFAQTDVSGVLNANITWTKSNSPYHVVGNFGINSGFNLTIEPGVEVNYTGNYEILVFGTLNIEGTKSDSVVFTSTTQGGLGTKKMIEFRRTNLSESSIKYVKFSGPQDVLLISRESAKDQEEIKVSGKLTIENSSFENSIIQTDGYDSKGSLLIKNSTLANMLVKGRFPKSEPIELLNCEIRNSTLYSDSYNKGIKVTNSTVKNSDFIVACCGAKFGIKMSKLSGCRFTSDNDYHRINILNSILVNCSFQEMERSYHEKQRLRITNSIIEVSDGSTISYQDIAVKNSSFFGNGHATGIVSSNSMKIENSNFLYWDRALEFKGTGSIEESNFIDNSVAVSVSGDTDIEASANFWDTENLDDVILDQNDYLNWGMVSVEPIATAQISNSTVLPPTNITVTKSGSKEWLSWEATEGLGYKLYYGKISDFDYLKSIDLGAVDQYDVSEVKHNTLVLTAYNEFADGKKDQRQGYESWYSKPVTTSYILDVAKPAVDLKMFPNPTRDKVFIEIKHGQRGQYAVLSMSGTMVKSGSLEKNTMIDFSQEPPGLYFITLNINEGVFTKKLIKR